MAFTVKNPSCIDSLIFLQPDGWIALYEIQIYLVT